MSEIIDITSANAKPDRNLKRAIAMHPAGRDRDPRQDEDLSEKFLNRWDRFFGLYCDRWPDLFPANTALSAHIRALEAKYGEEYTDTTPEEEAAGESLVEPASEEEFSFEARLIYTEIEMVRAGKLPLQLQRSLEGVLEGNYAVARDTQQLLWHNRCQRYLPGLDPSVLDQS